MPTAFKMPFQSSNTSPHIFSITLFYIFAYTISAINICLFLYRLYNHYIASETLIILFIDIILPFLSVTAFYITIFQIKSISSEAHNRLDIIEKHLKLFH